jgi:GTP-binding protein
MAENFIDYIRICTRSGRGGAGSVHFFRDKLNSAGGPDGGDGGDGGNIILKGNKQLWTLLNLRYRKHVVADEGGRGLDGNKTGANGKNIILEVPLGTVARDETTGEIQFEITEHGEQQILCPGGRGGKGNAFFKSSTHQTPRYAQPGEDGRNEWKSLELKILADVGLVGFPNAGKSTLLASITAAKPEIADYAFTTLVPNIGMVPYRDYRSFVMADIPGIIENAHLGKGIGHRFLRHIERNSTLLFLIPCDADSIPKQYDILINELLQFNPDLLDKPRVLAITKCDMIDAELEAEIRAQLPKGISTVFISAIAQQGLMELKDLLWTTMNPVV